MEPHATHCYVTLRVHNYWSWNKLSILLKSDNIYPTHQSKSRYIQETHGTADLQFSSFGRERHGTQESRWTDSVKHMQRPYPEFYLLCSMRFCFKGKREIWERTEFYCSVAVPSIHMIYSQLQRLYIFQPST